MQVQLLLKNGTIEDTLLLRNILQTYNIRADILDHSPSENEMGVEFLPALLLILPELNQLINTVLPAIKTYIEAKKPSGTKHEIELINGDKKIHIINEDGKNIDMQKITEFCNDTSFFEQ